MKIKLGYTICSYIYVIIMEMFLSRQNDRIDPVLDTCRWRCSVTALGFTFESHHTVTLSVDTWQLEVDSNGLWVVELFNFIKTKDMLPCIRYK